MGPLGFPSDHTGQRRLTVWVELKAFWTIWRRLAHRDKALPGSNWEEVLRDLQEAGKKGARGRQRECPIAAWRAFAIGVRQVSGAGAAALTYAWRNGPGERHIHRLKMIQPQRDGRANFDLFRARVL
jgi:transposase